MMRDVLMGRGVYVNMRATSYQHLIEVINRYDERCFDG